MIDPQYVPLSTIEGETEIVRRQLRRYGLRLQRQGDIPPEVPEAEINEQMDKHIPRIVQALHRSPLYPHLLDKGPKHLQKYIQSLIEAIP